MSYDILLLKYTFLLFNDMILFIKMPKNERYELLKPQSVNLTKNGRNVQHWGKTPFRMFRHDIFKRKMGLN